MGWFSSGWGGGFLGGLMRVVSPFGGGISGLLDYQMSKTEEEAKNEQAKLATEQAAKQAQAEAEAKAAEEARVAAAKKAEEDAAKAKAEEEAQKAAGILRRNRRGMLSTILTGTSGISSAANVERKTLLGA